LIPNLSDGIETAAPMIRPIPVSNNGGISESSVTSEARDAHKKIAPSVSKSAFIPKVYGTKNIEKKKSRKAHKKWKKQKVFSKNTPYTPVSARIGVYFIPKTEWKDTKE
jgi:hypothetical protein